MRKITTISLDEKTAVIAKQLPNFSHFVRECLLRHHAQSMNRDDCPFNKVERFGNRCVPRVHQRPHCFVCWPNGKPSEELVKSYLSHRDLKRLDEATKLENWELLEVNDGMHHSLQDSIKESATSPKTLGVRGYLVRLFKRK